MFALVKLINFFSAEPKLPLIPKGGPKPNIKKLFLQLTTCDDEQLSTPKIINSLATIHPFIFITIFYYSSRSKQTIF